MTDNWIIYIFIYTIQLQQGRNSPNTTFIILKYITLNVNHVEKWYEISLDICNYNHVSIMVLINKIALHIRKLCLGIKSKSYYGWWQRVFANMFLTCVATISIIQCYDDNNFPLLCFSMTVNFSWVRGELRQTWNILHAHRSYFIFRQKFRFG